MFAKQCRILHTSRKRKRRRKDPSCVRAPSVGLVIVVPHYVQIRHIAHHQKAQFLPFKKRSMTSKYSVRRPRSGGNNKLLVRQRDSFKLADYDHVVLTTRLIGWTCLTSISAHFLPLVFTSESTFWSALASVFTHF